MDPEYNYKNDLKKFNHYNNDTDTIICHGIILDKVSQKCIKNFELSINNKIEKYVPFKDEELYNYDNYYKY